MALWPDVAKRRIQMRRTRHALLFSLSLLLAAPLAAAEHHLTSVNIEYENTKVWVPSTFTVKKGDTVKLTLINNVMSEPDHHGFAIPNFGIAETVMRGEPKTITFTADKAGIFPIQCHLHPAHVGGQLVVLE